MYYISYFGNMRKIPKGIEVVGICHRIPEGLGIRNISDLAPTEQILRLWKRNEIDWNTYTYLYVRDVLYQLDFNDILKQLGTGNVCMCCYEKNGSHCHRYLVKRWFEVNGIEVNEL